MVRNCGALCGLIQWLETHSYTVEVTGSSPVAATAGVVEKRYFITIRSLVQFQPVPDFFGIVAQEFRANDKALFSNCYPV